MCISYGEVCTQRLEDNSVGSALPPPTFIRVPGSKLRYPPLHSQPFPAEPPQPVSHVLRTGRDELKSEITNTEGDRNANYCFDDRALCACIKYYRPHVCANHYVN